METDFRHGQKHLIRDSNSLGLAGVSARRGTYKIMNPLTHNIHGRLPQEPTHRNGDRGHIHLRTTMRRKSAYVRAAKPGKLTAWMIAVMDEAAGYKEDENGD